MRLLVLGGSVFVGRAVVETAVRRGWEVTVSNLDPDARFPPAVEHLIGDRTRPDGLAALRGRSWDVVVDTWAGRADAVRDAVALLAGRVRQYCYVSSLLALDWPPRRPVDESAALRPATPGSRTEAYPARKAAAERAVSEAFAGRHLIVRPGLVLGP